MRVRSIKSHPYDGTVRPVGEVYEMDEKHVEIMMIAGNIEPAASVETREMKSEGIKKYRRRDMKAEQ